MHCPEQGEHRYKHFRYQSDSTGLCDHIVTYCSVGFPVPHGPKVYGPYRSESTIPGASPPDPQSSFEEKGDLKVSRDANSG